MHREYHHWHAHALTRNTWVLATGDADLCRGANEPSSHWHHSTHDGPDWLPMAAADLP
jgi:hypothetical protein